MVTDGGNLDMHEASSGHSSEGGGVGDTAKARQHANAIKAYTEENMATCWLI